MSLGDLISGNNSTLSQIAQLGGPGNPGGSQVAFDQSNTPSQAQQSPPDLTQLYMKLYQQDRQADQFDRGLANVASAFAAPGTQSSVYNSLAGGGGNGGGRDPGTMIKNLMELQQAQTGQREHAQAAAGAEAAYQALFPNAKPGLGTELFNMGKLPDVLAGHIASMNPTEAMKNANDAVAASAAADPTMTPQAQASMKANLLANAMGGSDLNQRQYMGEKNSGLTTDDFATWTAKHQAQGKLLTDNAGDLSDAIKAAPALTTKVDEASNIVSGLKSNPSLGTALGVLSTPGGSAAAAAAHKSGAMSDDTYKAIQDIDQLSGQVYGEGFASTGSKRTQQEVSAIVSGLSQLKATGYSSDAYIKNALNPLQAHLDRTKANALGAAQQLDDIPANLRPLVNQQYLPGGSLYAGKGGAWATQAPPAPGAAPVQGAPPSAVQAQGAAVAAPAQAVAPMLGAGPSPSQIQKLKANPDKAADFDKLFGEGSSKKILGQ